MIVKRARLDRAAAAAWWAVPPLFCLWLYWYGLLAWFAQDDFAWLSLRLHVQNWREFVEAMFTPMAQGTIRPWSERGFFMLFSWLFGLDALPYRIWVFLTQFANLALLASITWKLTGSRTAGFLAPVLWTANSVLAVALSWTSSYNQVLCAFFILLAFRLFLRYVETGRVRDYLLQLGVFVLGFGALEINVVYPAIAAAYAAGCARKRLASTVPMFAISAAYALIHRSVAPRQSSGVYALHFDASIFETLGTYTGWALGPMRYAIVHPQWEWAAPFATAAIAVPLAAFSVWMLWRGRDRCTRWLPIFFLAWFLILLGPVLPLQDHVTEYYLTLPVAGLSALGGWGIAMAWRSGWGGRAVAAGAALIYLCTSIPVALTATRWSYQRSEAVRRLVFGVERAHQLHPGKAILLTGVGTDLFWAGVHDKPFRLLGIEEIYLAPGEEKNIQAHPELGSVSEHVFPEGIVARSIDRGAAVVYSAAGPLLRNVTANYRRSAADAFPDSLPHRVDAGNPVFADQLGPGWYPDEAGFRWMGKKASVRLAGPRSPEEKLHISGICPQQQFERGDLGVSASANGHPLGRSAINCSQPAFDLAWHLPADLVGTKLLQIDIEVERTIKPPHDHRELGLAFGSFSIQR